MHTHQAQRRKAEADIVRASAARIGDDDFLLGGGEMASLVRQKDWSQTPLGPIETWPQSLRTAASLCLASNFPINLIWGPEHTQIYNDGYRVLCGDAHPTALGQGYDVTWASAWPAIGGPFERALQGETSFIENQRMFLTRNGYLEETFFTFSLSPIRDESGSVGGVFHPVTETTRAMLSERRLRTLRDLSASLARAADLAEMVGMTVDTLSGFEYGLPFVLFYQLGVAGKRYHLAAHCGVEIGSGASPAEMSIEASAPWPVADAVRAAGILKCVGVRAHLHGVPCGPYDEAPDAAFVAPIRASGFEPPPAIVIFGVSSRLPVDDAYRGFFELLAASISSALRVVRTREDERRRAESLAEIDRAKTMFFSNVSHEFRTPLTLMLGPIEDALAQTDLGAAQRERLSIAHRNAQRLRKLVDSLLDFSRIEAGRANGRFAPTDLAALTADLASNFRSACEGADLGLLVDCPPLSQPVHVDRDMWERIVLNLLSNAFKFTLIGSIEVVLRETTTGTELVVRDSGVGIPTAELPRLFERFHRIEGQRGRSYEGSGIGLSMVRELVRLHGGTIATESTEGAGTTFRITVPFGAGHLPIDQVQPSATPTRAVGRSDAFVDEALQWLPDAHDLEPARSGPAIGASAPRVRGRIVVAEDNADMRNYLRRMLADDGYEVEAVANGAAALVAVRKNPRPDLVLTDVMMPELDGFALLRALRADPDLEELPVIMLSARAGEEARVEGLSAGADDYLVKPFSARELRVRIDSAVRLGQQRSARNGSGRSRRCSRGPSAQRSGVSRQLRRGGGRQGDGRA
jgi:signal transduction histidine kinase/CheY-like chemotaxis protein